MYDFQAPAPSVQPVPPVSELTSNIVTIAQYLTLAGAIIDVSTKNDTVLVFGAYMKLLAIFLFIAATFREAREQQTDTGDITIANKQKIAGVLLTLISALFLTSALLREIEIRRATGEVQPNILPIIGGTGALTV